MPDPYINLSTDYFEDKYRKYIIQELASDLINIFKEVNEEYTEKEIELLSNFVLNTYSEEEGISPEITLNLIANNALYAPNSKRAEDSLKIFEFMRQFYYYTYTYQEYDEKQENLERTVSALLIAVPEFCEKPTKELINKINTYQYAVHTWYMVNYILDRKNFYVYPYIDESFEDYEILDEDEFPLSRMPELPEKFTFDKKKYTEKELIQKVWSILMHNKNN
ncbi:hypothetical protein GF361_03105 [Candidatus Woesearchaeota archaeon]|nr:hypothetical protein [Candidatus Woesearchaeota archaeon]